MKRLTSILPGIVEVILTKETIIAPEGGNNQLALVIQLIGMVDIVVYVGSNTYDYEGLTLLSDECTTTTHHQRH